MQTILIAGGTGLVGSRLSDLLTEKGYKVTHLSRRANPSAKYKTYQWDLNKNHIEEAALQKANVVINLAGAGIADKRWTAARKQLIIDSRVKSNELLANLLPNYPNIKTYISASAIGYYGDRPADEVLKENASPGQTGFLAESVKAWEASIQKVAATDIRTVILRIGIVLSTKGGALEKLLIPFNFWMGTYFGDGKQVYSWIHIDDMCRQFIKAIENNEMNGTYNGVAPKPVSNKVFTELAAKAIDKSAAILPAPTFAMRLAMGEMADVVLTGSNVSSEKIEKVGFVFEFPELEGAIRDLVKRKI